MTLKRRWPVLLLFLSVIYIFISGCSETDAKTGQTVSKQEGQGTGEGQKNMGKTIMTETEKKLLIDVFGEEKRIEEGNLFSYQQHALEQLRAGEDYLERRYPEYKFQFESLNPANKLSPWAELKIRAEDSPACYVRIIPQGDGRKFVCEDNFYGYIFREKYDERIGQILAGEGCPAKSFTCFLSTADENLDLQGTVEELISYNPDLTRETALYTDQSSPDPELAKKMQNALSKAGMYGTYWLYFAGQEAEKDIRDLERNKSGWESLVFSCIRDQEE